METNAVSPVAWLPLAIALGILSIAVGDGLVLKRVCILWENRRLVYNILFIVWASVTTTALCVAIFAISRFAPEVVFDRDFDTCVPTSRIQLVAPAWGIPLIFDITVLVMTCWNALDRPRQLSTRLTTSLSKDGIFYFLARYLLVEDSRLIDGSALRILNSILFWKAPSSLILAGAYCSWALAVTVTSRLVINFRVVDLQKGSDTSMAHGRISPFDRSSSQTSSLDKIKIHREEEYELM
ncbi:hypothetical protein SISNIDRAFT_489217 [Sistotremastrum niveocremeum HHB9708]|uniref:STE3-domain-containing protein n=1 Tax=Sistotremastrum niveocremeum HHB9708 TaxID=1314777 RepID=A0A164QCE9_9AGAM|nr:hypothetical protein SISNIDRAFT_489217 [Sistotremastrum niveocremeum HHB9708]